MKLIFATTNKDKYFTAEQVLKNYGIELSQHKMEVDEIQSEDTRRIISDKANRMYELVKQPLIVSDDCWEIAGLNGFPGPYMKSILSWFSVEDFLRLTKDLKDRRITLIQNVAYQDKDGQKIFSKRIVGTLLKEKRGAKGKPSEFIISLTPDGKSLAEIYESGSLALTKLETAWPEAGAWLKQKYSL